MKIPIFISPPLALIIVLLLKIESSKLIPYRPSFHVTITHVIQPEGYSLKYFVTQDSIKLIYNCDYMNCKETVLYNKGLDSTIAINYYKIIKSLHLDTLKNIYQTRGLDGNSTVVFISGDSLAEKKITTVRFTHPIIRIIVDETNKLVAKKKINIITNNSYFSSPLSLQS